MKVIRLFGIVSLFLTILFAFSSGVYYGSATTTEKYIELIKDYTKDLAQTVLGAYGVPFSDYIAFKVHEYMDNMFAESGIYEQINEMYSNSFANGAFTLIFALCTIYLLTKS